MRRSRFGENFLFLLPLAFVVIAFLVGPDEVHGWSFPQQQQRRRPTTTTTTTTNQSPSSIRRKGSIQRSKGTITRQKLIQTFIVSTIGITIGGRGEGRFQQIAHAIEEVETISTSSSSSLYQRNVPGIKSSSISYQIQLPKDSSSSSSSSSSAFQESQKPVKTHLDEVNLMSDTIKGYQYGITVDPVRINSLKEVSTSPPSLLFGEFSFHSLRRRKVQGYLSFIWNIAVLNSCRYFVVDDDTIVWYT